MAAPSVGRLILCRARRSGGLDYSKPPLVVWARQKGCWATAFFLCRRPAAISTYYVRKKSLRFNVSFLPYKNCPRHSSCKTGYYMTNQYRNPNPV